MNKLFAISSFVAVTLSVGCAGGTTTPSATTPDATGQDGAAGATPAAGGSSPAPAGTELSELESKRLIESIQAALPTHKATFTSLCGGSVAIDIDWGSFGREKEALETLQSNYGAERVVAGFQGVCGDKSGKDAVKAKIKTLKLVNTRDAAKVSVTIAGGTLTATMSWSSGSPGMNENEIGAAITKQL